MNKISPQEWLAKPENYMFNYVAMDKNGSICAYLNIPYLDESTNCWWYKVYSHIADKVSYPVGTDWRNSLVSRAIPATDYFDKPDNVVEVAGCIHCPFVFNALVLDIAAKRCMQTGSFIKENELPYPDNCPLRTSDILIKLKI